MNWLHRRDYAKLSKALDIVRTTRFDMLDAVMVALEPLFLANLLEHVKRLLDCSVADAVQTHGIAGSIRLSHKRK